MDGDADAGGSPGQTDLLEARVRLDARTPLARIVDRVPGGEIHVPTVLAGDGRIELPFSAAGGQAMRQALETSSGPACCSVEVTGSTAGAVEGWWVCRADAPTCPLGRGGLADASALLGPRAELRCIEVRTDATVVEAVVAGLSSKSQLRDRLDRVDGPVGHLDVLGIAVTPVRSRRSGGPWARSSRLRETIETAIRMGYYEVPRGCTMDDMADVLGLSKSAVCHRINELERVAVDRLHEELAGDAGVGGDPAEPPADPEPESNMLNEPL